MQKEMHRIYRHLGNEEEEIAKAIALNGKLYYKIGTLIDEPHRLQENCNVSLDTDSVDKVTSIGIYSSVSSGCSCTRGILNNACLVYSPTNTILSSVP